MIVILFDCSTVDCSAPAPAWACWLFWTIAVATAATIGYVVWAMFRG